MSLVLFLDRLNKSRLHPNDIKWMPAWFTQFATGRPVVDGFVPFEKEDVLKFLQKLRDSHVPCWQRLQAARSLEWYQTMVLPESKVDFSEFKLKLQEMAEKERRAQFRRKSRCRKRMDLQGRENRACLTQTSPSLCKLYVRECEFCIIRFLPKIPTLAGSQDSFATSMMKTWRNTLRMRSENS